MERSYILSPGRCRHYRFIGTWFVDGPIAEHHGRHARIGGRRSPLGHRLHPLARSWRQRNLRHGSSFRGLARGPIVTALRHHRIPPPPSITKVHRRRPVSGHGTNIIRGLAILRRPRPARLDHRNRDLVRILRGLYGSPSRLEHALHGRDVVAIDAYGPINDNAGIAEMAERRRSPRRQTDAVGTHEGRHQRLAIGSPVSRSFSASYTEAAGGSSSLERSARHRRLFIGGLPYIRRSVHAAVGKAAVRSSRSAGSARSRHHAGHSQVDYARCVIS